MSAELTRDQFAEYFFIHIRRRFKRQTKAAEHYGVSPGFISAVCRGVKPPTKKMLSDIGITREVRKVEVYKLIVDQNLANKGSTGNVATGKFEVQ